MLRSRGHLPPHPTMEAVQEEIHLKCPMCGKEPKGVVPSDENIPWDEFVCEDGHRWANRGVMGGPV